MFSHDPQSVTCSFWRQGKCRKGDLCEFRHGEPERGPEIRSALPSGTSAASPSFVLNTTVAAEHSEIPGAWAAVAAQGDHGAVPDRRQALPEESVYGRRNRDRPRKQKIGGEEVPWIATGDAVNSLYLKLRDQAQQHALARNICFEQATNAYLAGKPAEAKQLSRVGRVHQQHMKELHELAALETYDLRNASLRGRGVIDLHGLHPNEASAIALREVQAHAGSGGYLYLVIGTGHHSRTGGSKLGDAVVQALRQSGANYAEVSAGGHGGLLRVQCL